MKRKEQTCFDKKWIKRANRLLSTDNKSDMLGLTRQEARAILSEFGIKQPQSN